MLSVYSYKPDNILCCSQNYFTKGYCTIDIEKYCELKHLLFMRIICVPINFRKHEPNWYAPRY
jgi:hypothetical protein